MRKINLEHERNFENKKASGEPIRAAQSKYYWATSLPEIQHREKTYEKINDRDVLEIGCASGRDAIGYSQHARTYIGIDISDVAIENCKRLSLENAFFECTDGHKIPLADQAVDCVIVNALLHHLDLNTAFMEISRVLRDDGVLIFREPLGINPVFKVYRLLTPSARTPDERPFSYADLELMKNYFSLKQNLNWYGFLSLVSSFGKSDQLRKILTECDRYLSKTILRYWFWNISGIVYKKTKI